jgi:hypothetical protein
MSESSGVIALIGMVLATSLLAWIQIDLNHKHVLDKPKWGCTALKDGECVKYEVLHESK